MLIRVFANDGKKIITQLWTFLNPTLPACNQKKCKRSHKSIFLSFKKLIVLKICIFLEVSNYITEINELKKLRFLANLKRIVVFLHRKCSVIIKPSLFIFSLPFIPTPLF